MSPDEPDEDFLKLSSQVILSQCKLIFKTELVIDYKKKALKKKKDFVLIQKGVILSF